MPELFDTKSVRDDAAHWEQQAARVAERAMREGAGEGVASRDSLNAWSRSRATWAAACLLFAAGLVLMVLSNRAPAADDATTWRVVLAPPDDVGQLLATRAGPPSIGVLVLEPETGAGRP